MKARQGNYLHGWSLSLIPLLATLAIGCATTEEEATAPVSEAERVVGAMIEAHGGMEAWSTAPTVSFQDVFHAAPDAPASVSRVTVEQGRRRSYIDYPGTEMRMSWDGERAWSENWQLPYPPRFMALLNYYFVNLPWLTQDPGVILGEPSTAKLWDDATEYITLRMTYEAGVGDTPDDYYILYIDPVTHLIKACEYTVTYGELLPEGVESTPPHILVYDDFETVNDLQVPVHYTIYEKDHTYYASCDIEEWSFSQPFDEDRMVMVEAATLDTSTP